MSDIVERLKHWVVTLVSPMTADLRSDLHDAASTITALREEVRRARFAPLGDNHHNALACPYCNPKQLDPEAELTALRRRVVELGGAIVARVHERQTLLSTSAPVRALATLINEIKETTDG